MATSTKIEISAVDKTQRAFSSVQTSLKKMAGALTSTQAAVGGLVAGFAANQFTGFLDTATRIENKLKLVTKSSTELAKAQAEVYRVAQTTGAGLEQTANLYSKIVASTETLNLSSKDQIRITEAVSKALVISGATAEGAAGAITQLGQALGSGALRGEEFNSVNEQAPRIMQALADSLGVPRGQLKKLASDGVLTSEIVTEALLLQSDTIDSEYGKTTATVAQSFTKLKNSAVVFFGVLDDNTGISTLFSEALARMARGLGNVTEAIKPATVQSLSKEIRDLSTAQRDELLALDKLVTENGDLNVMQENQARIMRLNIAERGEKIKKLREELESINNLATTQKEETKETGKATSASKLTAEQLERRKKLREQLNKLTGGALELSKEEIKFQTKIYEIGQKNSLLTGEASEANKAFFESNKQYLSVSHEIVATELQKKIFLQAHADLMAQQEETAKRLSNIDLQRKRFLQAHADLMKAAEETKRRELEIEGKIYDIGQKNSLVTGEISSASKAYFDSMKDHLTVVEEVKATEMQKKLFLQAHADLMEEQNKKKEKQLELEQKIYAIGQKNSLMTGKASEASEAFFKANEKYLAGQKSFNIQSAAKGVAGNAMFGAVAGAAGASGSRAMNIIQATAQGGPIAGVMALVLSNKKVQEALGKIFDALFKLIDPLIDLLVPALEALIPAIEALQPLFEMLKPYFQQFGYLLKHTIGVLTEAIYFIVNLSKALEALPEAFNKIVTDMLMGLTDMITKLPLALAKFVEGFGSAIGAIFESLGTSLLDLPVSMYTAVFNAVAHLPQAIYDAIKGLFDFGGGSNNNYGLPKLLKNGGEIPKAQAGMLVGPSHSSGGQLINAEGGEFIFSRKAVSRIGAARLSNMNNGSMADYAPIEVNIYDGTGQRISEYDSALRVEIKERAARNRQFAAVA